MGALKLSEAFKNKSSAGGSRVLKIQYLKEMLTVFIGLLSQFAVFHVYNNI